MTIVDKQAISHLLQGVLLAIVHVDQLAFGRSERPEGRFHSGHLPLDVLQLFFSEGQRPLDVLRGFILRLNFMG